MEISSPIAVDVVVTNTGKGLLVRGTLECNVQYQCTRCLREFPSTLTGDVEEFYRTSPEAVVVDDGDDFFPDEAETLVGDEIDLTEPLRGFALAVPMNPLLCRLPRAVPKCGQPRSANL